MDTMVQTIEKMENIVFALKGKTLYKAECNVHKMVTNPSAGSWKTRLFLQYFSAEILIMSISGKQRVISEFRCQNSLVLVSPNSHFSTETQVCSGATVRVFGWACACKITRTSRSLARNVEDET